MKTKISNKLKHIIFVAKERNRKYNEACRLIGINCYSQFAVSLENEIQELELLLNDIENEEVE